MKDFEGALGEGTDTPDKAIARKAAAAIFASRAGDKEAGLAQGKQASFGGLGRLFEGNIDAPGSEASGKYGAGAGATMRTPAAPPRPPVASAPVAMRPAVDRNGMDTSPAPVVSTPDVDLGKILDEAGTKSKFRRNTETGETYDPGSATDKKPAAAKNRIVSKAELAKSGLTLRDFLNKERGLKRRPNTTDYEAALKSVAKGKATKESDMQIDSRKKGGSIKAYAKGGSVSSRADGCAQRGKTRGMMR
jgi:hypothetical protein